MRPTTSVVIPSYNHGRFIVEAVESAWAAGADEVVIVDDGSRDDTLERLAPLTGDPRLRLYPQANQGAHAALNRGLELARGEVLAILNSDDAFAPHRLERALASLADPGVALVGSWIELIDAEGQTLGIKEAFHNMPPWVRRGSGPGLSEEGEPQLALLEANYLATTSNVVFRRSLLETGLRFLPLRYAHDWDFFLGACRHGELALLPEPLVRYRIHPDNTIGEERHAEEARGLMRYEVLWIIARHAAAMRRRFAARGFDATDFDARLAGSLPPFVSLTLFSQLLFLRGDEAEAPAAYDELLAPDHPLRQQAIRLLATKPA